MTELLTLKINKGKDVKTEIELFFKAMSIKKLFIAGAVGSVTEVCLTVPTDMQLPPKIERINIQGPAEIVSFTGEVMEKSLMDTVLKSIYQNDEFDYFIHIHASLGVKGAVVYGGGFLKGKVFRGLNVYFWPIN